MKMLARPVSLESHGTNVFGILRDIKDFWSLGIINNDLGSAFLQKTENKFVGNLKSFKLFFYFFADSKK